MAKAGHLKRFILFTAASRRNRKDFVASFSSREEAIAKAEIMKTDGTMRWQVFDNHISEVVAEDPGA
jgi:hypothetical protein